jgi:hypothetical protein
MEKIIIGEYYTLVVNDRFFIFKALENEKFSYFEKRDKRFVMCTRLNLYGHMHVVMSATDFYKDHLDACINANDYIDLPEFDFTLPEILKKLNL